MTTLWDSNSSKIRSLAVNGTCRYARAFELIDCRPSAQRVADAVIQHRGDQHRRAHRTAGEGQMLDARQEIEAFGLAPHAFRHQLSVHAGKRHALAGIAMGIIDGGRKPAAIGDAVGGDGDVAAPGMIDLHILELRKHRRSCAAAYMRRDWAAPVSNSWPARRTAGGVAGAGGNNRR